MKKKKILILGASGFIGTHLVNFYVNKLGFEVHGVSFARFPRKVNLDIGRVSQTVFHRVNLSCKNDTEHLFNSIRPDIVLQYAANTTNSKDVIESPFNHSTVNYCINAIALEAAHKVGVKHFIYPSCCTMYQSSKNQKKETDWSLDTIPHCYKHVAYMKTAVERMMEAYASMGECKYTVIRQSNIYGAHDKTDLNKSHVLMSMIMKVLAAKNTIEVWGDGKAKRDLVYVEDLVDLVSQILEKQKTSYEIINASHGRAWSVNQIIDTICDLEDKEIEKIYNNTKPNIPTITIPNPQKAKDLFGWAATTPLKEGIGKTIEWYKNI